MKKFGAGLLVFISLMAPVSSYAMQAPLNLKGKSVYLSDNSNVSLISYLVFLRVRTGFTSGNTSMVVKNENTDESVTFFMGIPTYLDSVSNVRDLSVTSNSKTLKYYERNTLQDSSNGKATDIKKWYVWEISLEPGESRLIECAFSIDNKTELNGTKSIDIPLHLLESWAGQIGNVQIIADLDFYPPYVFEPNPSIIPIEYDRDGRLTWKFSDVNSFSSNLSLYFKPIDTIITNYIDNKLPSNEEIKNALDLFKTKNYHAAIRQIGQLLSAEADHEITSVSSELKFIRALCYQELFQLDDALEQFNEIENNVGFGEVLSNTIRNKIIYDKTSILKSLHNGEEKALAYLNEVKPTIKNNEVFLIWLNDEVKRLTPDPPEDEKPEKETEEPVLEGQEKSASDKAAMQIIDSINILGYELPIEVVIGGILLIIIILLLIKRSRQRKRQNRYSIFR